MGPGNYGLFPVHFLLIFGLAIRFLKGGNNVNIDKNRYILSGSFLTLFISGNPRWSDPKHRRFSVRLIRVFNPCVPS